MNHLAGQTAIYGGTTVLSRLLNYLLVPLHTYLFSNAADYGVVGELYAWTSLFIVILTYGMETAFFKFSQDDEIKDRVYSTVVGSLFVTSTLFIVLCSIFAQPIADWLRYPTHPEYVRWFAVIIGVDALTSIFFAHLRFLNRPIRFAAVKITNILVNVLLNLFFLLLCPWLLTKNPDSAFVNAIYNQEIGVGYIFIANLVASVVTLLMLFKRLSLAAEPQASVGIYSACYKISILMTIFIQAFKYAAEPFFFRKAKDKDAKETYAEVMTAFVLVCSVIFVGIMLYMDLVQYFVGATYRVGLPIVPILLMANLFLGIFYNLSIWYTLTGQTKFGAYIALFGAAITLALNWLLIPRFDYMGAAWTTFACYLSMMVVSYLLGQKYYHVDYDLKRILFYLFFAVAVYGLSLGVNRLFGIESMGVRLAVNTVILVGYLGVLAWMNKEMLRGILKRG